MLQELRLKKGLTAQDMAESLGISRAHYSHLEKGRRRFTEDLLKRTAGILGVSKSRMAELSEKAVKRNAVPNSWIFKVQIEGKPFIKAFQEYYENIKSNGDIEVLIAEFITTHMKHVIREELANNPDISKYILTRLNG